MYLWTTWWQIHGPMVDYLQFDLPPVDILAVLSIDKQMRKVQYLEDIIGSQVSNITINVKVEDGSIYDIYASQIKDYGIATASTEYAMDLVLSKDFSTAYSMNEDGTYTPHQLFDGLSLNQEGTFNPASMGAGQIDQGTEDGLLPLLSQMSDDRSKAIINSIFLYQVATMQYAGLASLSQYEWAFLSANIDEKSWTYLFYQFENYKLRMMQADEGKIYTIDDQVFASGGLMYGLFLNGIKNSVIENEDGSIDTLTEFIKVIKSDQPIPVPTTLLPSPWLKSPLISSNSTT